MPGCVFALLPFIGFIICIQAKCWDTAFFFGMIIFFGILGGVLNVRDKKKRENNEL